MFKGCCILCKNAWPFWETRKTFLRRLCAEILSATTWLTLRCFLSFIYPNCPVLLSELLIQPCSVLSTNMYVIQVRPVAKQKSLSKNTMDSSYPLQCSFGLPCISVICWCPGWPPFLSQALRDNTNRCRRPAMSWATTSVSMCSKFHFWTPHELEYTGLLLQATEASG